MSKKKKFFITCLIILAILGSWVWYSLYNHPPNGPTIFVSGNIEVTTVDVAFKIAGKIERLLVEEGDLVKEGQLIATLEHQDLLAQKAKLAAALEAAQSRLPVLQKNIAFQEQAIKQEIAQAAAGVEAAQSRLQLLLNGARPQEIQMAKAEVDRALADLEKRQADKERAEKLYRNQYISAQDWDLARTAYEAALAIYQRAQENYALVLAGSRPEEIDQARAQLAQAQATLKLAETRRMQIEVLRQELATAQAQIKEAASALKLIETQIAYCRLLAPLAGVVLVKNAEVGEFIVPGSAVITLGDITKPWLKAFINENDLGRVKLGQKVSVTTDSYPGKIYIGKITFISAEAEFTPKNVQTAKERVKLVYRIKVSLDNPQFELKPGMPAEAQIHLEENK
jgi:HlyD family secretion protein